MKTRRVATILAILLAARAVPGGVAAADLGASDFDRIIGKEYASLDSLYRDLHARPELSLHEQETARRIASELKTSGFEVTTGVGGNGVVAVLRNGQGPTDMWRSDLDALPVKEETGVPYASTVTATEDTGPPGPGKHTVGHDMHMTTLAGL